MDSLLLAVTCLLWAALAGATYTPRQLYRSLELSEANVQDTYDGLNANKDRVLDAQDLEIYYFHKDTGFAKTKFMELVDTKSKDGRIEKEELGDFLRKQHITNAIWECTYVHSESLREYCFADQVLTYVLLIIDIDAIHSFYEMVLKKTGSSQDIKPDELTKLAEEIPEFNAIEQQTFMAEIGGEDGVITYEDFKEYVEQEDLQEDFRRCRQRTEGIKGVYDNVCLLRELADYTMMELTELEMATLFRDYDHNDDRGIVVSDLTKARVCESDVAHRFISLMDKTGDSSVSYGEFRTYLRTHSVRMQLERDCSEVHAAQHEEMVCYKAKVTELVIQNHTPVLMRNVYLDITILFEDLDVSDDGMIKVEEDLVQGKSWAPKIANKMANEMDGRDPDDDVSLEEFVEYVGYPNMIYGMDDCLAIKNRVDRNTCYETELKDIISAMLDKSQVKAFFNYLDNDNDKKITKKEVEERGIKVDDADNLLVEMGMGDLEIIYSEFFWFVRQKRISHMFEQLPPNKAPRALLPLLVKYISEVMTEHDTEELFTTLDKDEDWELELSDFAGNREDVIALVARMDSIGEDQDSTVNFVEFWLYLNTPIGTPRKNQLEETCTKPNKKQADQLACYATTIVSVN